MISAELSQVPQPTLGFEMLDKNVMLEADFDFFKSY